MDFKTLTYFFATVLIICLVSRANGNRLLKILKSQVNQMKSNFDRDISELKYEVLDLSADVEIERQRINEIDKRLNDSIEERGETGSKRPYIPVEMHNLLEKVNELNERLDKESSKRKSLEETVKLLKNKCGLVDSHYVRLNSQQKSIDELKESIAKLEEKADSYQKIAVTDEMSQNDKNELKRLSNSIKMAFNVEKRFIRNFTQTFNEEYERERLSINPTLEKLVENTNTSIEEIRVNLTVKLDNAVQNIENARHNTESIDLRMSFIEDEIDAKIGALQRIQKTKADWKDIVNGNGNCGIDNGTAIKEKLGASLYSVSCKSGFRPSHYAKFYKCENDHHLPFLDDEYRLIASSEETVTCVPDPLSAAPMNVVGVAISPDRIYLEWDKPVLSGWDIQGYTIFYTAGQSNPLSVWETKDSYKGRRMATLNGLVPNCTYAIRVLAYAEMVQGPLSESVNVMTKKGVPMQPNNLRVSALTPNALEITWAWPMKLNVNTIQDYELFYYDSLFRQNYSVVIYPPATKYKLTDLTPDTIYHLQMSARNQHGEGAQTNIVQAKTPVFIPKQPKRVYAAAVSSTAIYVEWWSPSFPDWRRYGIIRGYTVYFAEVGGNDDPVDVIVEGMVVDTCHGDRCEAVIVDLKPETRYRIQVAGYTRKGDGLRSDSKFVTTRGRLS